MTTKDGGNDKRDPDDPGFVVIDKRGKDDPEPEPETAPETPAPSAEAPPRSGSGSRGTSGPPRVDFAALVISLASSAMVHLGLVPDPESGQPAPKNRELARHTIDTLEVLQAKTRGNLEPDEEKLLQGALTELRMRFVEAKD